MTIGNSDQLHYLQNKIKSSYSILTQKSNNKILYDNKFIIKVMSVKTFQVSQK